MSALSKRFLFKVSGAILPLVLSTATVHAGAYIFAGEANGVNSVVHPIGYTGTGGILTLRVCIDPASPNASSMEYSLQNIVDVYNQLQPTMENLKSGGNNNVPSNVIDFESVALHEVGHCLGLNHINAASESGFSGNNANYTKATDGVDNVLNIGAGPDGIIGSSDDVRGDDVNLVWFRRSNNDPFTIDTVVDSTTYSRDPTDLPEGHVFAVNADRDVSTFLGHPKSEAVMQQGTFYDEAQRTLGHDDVAALRYAASGTDELESGGPAGRNSRDNYTVVLENGGVSSVECDISMRFTDTTSLAFCAANGAGIETDHWRITTANIEFGQGFSWYFNSSNTAPVLDAIANKSLTEGDVVVVPVVAIDAGDVLSFSVSNMPAFADLVDNNDGTATLTLAPVPGDALISTMTITVTDSGNPALSDSQSFEVNVSSLDTDGDGLSDFDEINMYGTSPTDSDSDGDRIDDGIEVGNGSDPADPTSWPNFADGDIAPLGAPDGLINVADFLVMQRIVLGEVEVSSLELAHGDLYPAGAPDGVMDVADLVLMLKLVQ